MTAPGQNTGGRALLQATLRDTPRAGAQLVASILLAGAAMGASVALMGVAAWLLSRAAEHPPFLYLQVAALGVRFFGIARALLRYLERLVGHDLALRLQSSLRLRSYAALARTTSLGRRRGDLLVRLVSDIEAIQDLVVRVLVPFCGASLVIVGTTVMLGRFSPGSAAVLLGTAVLAGLVVPWFTRAASRRVDEDAVPARGDLGATVHELSRTAPDLLAYGATRSALERMALVDERLRRAEARGAWVRGLAQSAQIIAAGVAVLAALVIGGQAVLDQTMAPRLLAVLVLTPLALHESLDGLAQAAQTYTRVRVALGRTAAVIDAPPVGAGDLVGRARVEHPRLVVDDLTAGWPGHPPVVRHLSLRVDPGQRVALTGPSGVGKTTVAATLLGMIPAQGGSVSVEGTVGYLAQDAHVFATSVAENIRIGDKDADDTRLRAALRRVRLALDPDRLVGEYGGTLSGGEARRLAMARLFVGEPQVVILDEPTEHVDRATADALLDDLWSLTHGRPVLVITHDPDLLARCDAVITLERSHPATPAD